MKTWRVALFASGAGSNALRIMEYFHNHPQVSIVLLLSNKSDAGALNHAEDFGIAHAHVSNAAFKQGDDVLQKLQAYQIDIVVLAGFLLLVPSAIIQAYSDRIVNIHPALLPKFGGKGMYGHFVHEAVVDAGETTSGITIHLVNDHYDEGRILAQFDTSVKATDGPKEVESKVRALELLHYAPTIENWLNGI